MALVKWIDPVKTQTGPSAAKYYGSGTMPPNLRPAFLHDRGGAGGPQQLLGPKDGEVGQPYAMEYWTYSFYLDGKLVGKTGPYLRTHSQGYAGITQAFNSWQINPSPGYPAAIPFPGAPIFGTYKAVCGSYTKVNLLNPPVSYCTYDGVKTIYGAYQPPPPAPLPNFFFPFPYSGFFRQRIPLGPFGATAPFGARTTTVTTYTSTRIPRPPVPFLFGHDGRVGQDVTDSIAYKTCMNQRQQQCVNLNPGADPTPGSAGYSAWVAQNVCVQAADLDCKAKAAGGGGGGGDVTALQNQINTALASQNICPIGVDGKLGPTTCSAAAYVQQNIDPSVNLPPACGAILANSSSSGFDPDCKTGGGGTPPPPPPCTPTSCGPTQECFGTKCVDKCPTGYKRADDGSCVTAATTAGVGGGGAGLAWLLGIGAAVGAIFLGIRAPKNLPKQPARARHARAMKRRAAPRKRREAA